MLFQVHDQIDVARVATDVNDRKIGGVLTVEILGVERHDAFVDERHGAIDDCRLAMSIHFTHCLLVQCGLKALDHAGSVE